MRRNYTEEELNLQASSSRKYWEQYKSEREAKRLEARRRIAAAILIAEMNQKSEPHNV
jgi:hypothetical protein